MCGVGTSKPWSGCCCLLSGMPLYDHESMLELSRVLDRALENALQLVDVQGWNSMVFLLLPLVAGSHLVSRRRFQIIAILPTTLSRGLCFTCTAPSVL